MTHTEEEAKLTWDGFARGVSVCGGIAVMFFVLGFCSRHKLDVGP